MEISKRVFCFFILYTIVFSCNKSKVVYPEISYLEEIDINGLDSLSTDFIEYLNIVLSEKPCQLNIPQDSILAIVKEARCNYIEYDYEKGDSIYFSFFKSQQSNKFFNNEILLNELLNYVGSTSISERSIRLKYEYLEDLLSQDYFSKLSDYWKTKIYIASAGFYRSRNCYDQAYAFANLALQIKSKINDKSFLSSKVLYTYILLSVSTGNKESSRQIVDEIEIINIDDRFLNRWIQLAKYSFFDSITNNNIEKIERCIEQDSSDPISKATTAWLIMRHYPTKAKKWLMDVINQSKKENYALYFANYVMSEYFAEKGNIERAIYYSNNSFPHVDDYKDVRYLVYMNKYISLLIKENKVSNNEKLRKLINQFYNHLEKVSTDDARHFGDFIVNSNKKILAYLQEQNSKVETLDLKRLIIQGISLGKYIDLKDAFQGEQDASVKDRFKYNVALKKFTQLKLKTLEWSNDYSKEELHSSLFKLLVSEGKIYSVMRNEKSFNEKLYDTLAEWSFKKETSILDFTFLDTTLLITSINSHNFKSKQIDTSGIKQKVNYTLDLIQSKDTIDLYNQLDSLYGILIDENVLIHNSTVAISADQYLENYPFETLRKNTLFNSSIYWVEEKNIFYTSNIESLIQHQSIKLKPKNGLLISFSNDNTIRTSNRLDELVYSQKEIQLVNNIFCHGKCMVNKGGNTNYDINDLDFTNVDFLHIASHAKSGNSEINKNYLLIRNSNLVDTLYEWDLFRLVPNANLVFLSTCSSGVGVYNKGLGNNSISKNFKLSRNGNVVETLWEIDDSFSYLFVKRFYENLDTNTFYKSISIPQREFINSKSIYRMPYYWSAFKLNIAG